MKFQVTVEHGHKSYRVHKGLGEVAVRNLVARRHKTHKLTTDPKRFADDLIAGASKSFHPFYARVADVKFAIEQENN